MLRLQALSSAAVATMYFMLLFAAKVAWCIGNVQLYVSVCWMLQKSFNLNNTGVERVEVE